MLRLLRLKRLQILLAALGVAVLALLLIGAWPWLVSRAAPTASSTVISLQTGNGMQDSDEASRTIGLHPKLASDAPSFQPPENRRNPFQFGSDRALVRRGELEGGADFEVQAPVEPSAGEAAASLSPPASPSRPPIAMTFIGTVDAPGQGGTLAVLSDGERVFHGREGDIVDGRFRIVRIEPTSVDLTYPDGQARQTLPLQ